MELAIAIVLVVVIVVLIIYTISRITVGGDGIWHGPGEPPEGFVGFWDDGRTVVQWPAPSGEVYETAFVGTITADNIVSGSFTAQHVSTEDIISDPDLPGYLPTKQELAQRRLDEG